MSIEHYGAALRLCAIAMLAGSGCGDSAAEPAQDASTTGAFCQQFSAFSQEIGCEPVEGCQTDPSCDSLGKAWLDCLKRDLSQCLCETDGDINCEGSFKPNEGPALCITEYEAVSSCAEQ